MARKDAMSDMREALITRREALRKALAGDLSMLKDLADQSGGDVVDFALDSTQDEISSQLAEVESRELSQIDKALERMRDGTYGMCEACDAKIPVMRLQALPYAVLCIDCQRMAEEQGLDTQHVADWSQLLDLPSDGDPVLGDFGVDLS